MLSKLVTEARSKLEKSIDFNSFKLENIFSILVINEVLKWEKSIYIISSGELTTSLIIIFLFELAVLKWISIL